MSLSDSARGVVKNILERFAQKPPTPGEGFRLFLKEAMPLCPQCAGTMSGHVYQQAASLAVKEGNAGKLQEFFKTYDLNQWDKLSQFQEWDGTLDNVVAWLFRCPDGRHLLAIMYDPYELYDSVSILRQKQVDASGLPLLQNVGQTI
jgi:hypothetical protein